MSIKLTDIEIQVTGESKIKLLKMEIGFMLEIDESQNSTNAIIIMMEEQHAKKLLEDLIFFFPDEARRILVGKDE